MTSARCDRELVADQRGAIMVLGLGAALLLIGCLWFLMGIADTLVWRDKMQEAVDAAAFSSATVHARGMNFIAALNLVMLGLVTIHMVLGLVADALTVVAAICLIPPLEPAVPKVLDAALKVRDAQNAYDTFMWPSLHVLNGGQTIAAIAVPHLGTLAAREVTDDYGVNATAFGPSNVPGIIPVITNVKTPDGLGGLGGMRLGLPVAYEPYKAICRRPVSWALDWVMGTLKRMAFVRGITEAVRKIPVAGEMLATEMDGVITSGFKRAAAWLNKGLVILECDDGKGNDGQPKEVSELRESIKDVNPLGAPPNEQWSWPGAKKMWKFGSNGSDWMQIWATTDDASKIDDDERKVAIGRRKYGDVGTTTVRGTYLAQAEFFYDCRDSSASWSSSSCNGTLGDSQFAVHNMRWKARLRRYRGPAFARFLAETAFAGFDGFDAIGKLVAKIPGVEKKLFGIIDLKAVIKHHISKLITSGIAELGTKPGEEIIH